MASHTSTVLSKDAIERYGWTAMPRSFKKMLSGVDEADTSASRPDFSAPQTALAQRIHDYAKTELPEKVYNHSMRVYYYGWVIISQHFPHLSPMLETYFLCCMLHDIGITPKNIASTALSFEFHGGYLALNLLRKEGAPAEQAEAVAEAIIRHQDLGETGNIQAVEAILQLATVFDNAGFNPHLVHKETIVAVTGAFPRNQWSTCFADSVKLELALKPWAHSTAIENFAELVEGNTLMAPYDS